MQDKRTNSKPQYATLFCNPSVAVVRGWKRKLNVSPHGPNPTGKCTRQDLGNMASEWRLFPLLLHNVLGCLRSWVYSLPAPALGFRRRRSALFLRIVLFDVFPLLGIRNVAPGQEKELVKWNSCFFEIVMSLLLSWLCKFCSSTPDDGVLKLTFNPTTAVLKALSAESPSHTINQNWQWSPISLLEQALELLLGIATEQYGEDVLSFQLLSVLGVCSLMNNVSAYWSGVEAFSTEGHRSWAALTTSAPVGMTKE